MSDFFQTVISDLNKHWGADGFEDVQNSFSVTSNNGLRIFIELYGDPQKLLILCNIGDMPEGANRKLWFQEALRWNGDRSSGEGVFSFNSDSGQLAIHTFLELETLTTEQLDEMIWKIEEKANIWKQAFIAGYPPELSGAGTITESSGPSGFMGIRP